MKRVVFSTTTRREGNARNPATLVRLLRSRRAPRRLATAEQVHGGKVAVVAGKHGSKRYPAVDGLLTAEPGQALGIFTADCASIFLTTEPPHVIGVLHAGWRGVRAGILQNALRVLRRRWHYRSSDVSVDVGPCIGPCCFEVQWDVAQHFPKERKRRGPSWTVDLSEAIRNQARQAGVPASRIQISGVCTMHTRRYYSYRRDKTVERQISIGFRRDH